MGAIMDKIKGTAKKIEGRLTKDRVRETQGKVEETKADVEIKAKRTGNRIKAGVRKFKDRVTARVSEERAAARERSARRRSR